MKPAIPYYRVSTDRQGQSGLGLEAQKQAVNDFARGFEYQIIGEFHEVESGANDKRPALLDALDACKRQNAILLIARLDRLGRDLLFIATLLKSGVKFEALDIPHADKFVIHVMAAFAERERERISANTKAALAAAKLRGVQLGRFAKEVLAERNKQKSQAFNREMLPLLKRLKENGFTSVRKIADELNRLGIPTYRKGNHKWHVRTVHKIIQSTDARD